LTVYNTLYKEILIIDSRSGRHEAVKIVRRCKDRSSAVRSWTIVRSRDLLENLTVKTALPEDGVEKRRNWSQY